MNQKNQHVEQVAMQQESLDKQIEYYNQNKELEDRRIESDRKYQLEQLQLQQANLDLQVLQSKKQFEFSQTMTQLGIYMDTVNGQLKTLSDVSLANVLAKVTAVVDKLLELPDPAPAPTAPKTPSSQGTGIGGQTLQDTMSQYTMPSSSGSSVGSSSNNVVIPIYIGGELLKTYIVDIVTKEVTER